MPIENQTYGEGRKLSGGWISTLQVALAAATYHIGMLLEYLATTTGVTVGTGDGTGTTTSGADVKIGAYVLTFTAALVADLTGPDGEILAQGLTFGDGVATVVKVAGLTITVTDGATAFIAGDTITLTVAAGEYSALADGVLAGIYNGTEGRVLSSSGVDDVIVAGEISESGIVDGAGAALALTADQVALFGTSGFYFKKR